MLISLHLKIGQLTVVIVVIVVIAGAIKEASIGCSAALQLSNLQVRELQIDLTLNQLMLCRLQLRLRSEELRVQDLHLF